MNKKTEERIAEYMNMYKISDINDIIGKVVIN